MESIFKKRASLKRHTGRLPKGDKVEKFDMKRSAIGKPGFKRPHKAGVFVERKIVKKKSSTDEDRVQSGGFYEKPVNGASSEEEAEVVHRKSTTYDDLLKRLGSRNESVANAFRRRKREEHGESDTDEEADSDPDSQSDVDENDDDLES